MKNLTRRDLKQYAKGIARDAICAEIEAIFEEFAAISDDEDKDQLCRAEFGLAMRAILETENISEASLDRVFNNLDKDENDDICKNEFAKAMRVRCDFESAA